MILNLLKKWTKLIILTISLSLNNSYAEIVSDNLISDNFKDGSWSDNGTGQLNSTHGNYTIAGIHNGQVETTVSLNEADINKGSLNAGFTSRQSSRIIIWSGVTQSVTMSQTLVDDNGNTITQSSEVTAYGGNTYYNTIIVGENSAQDYNVTARWDISTPGYTYGHYGADITSPYLRVFYNYVPDYTAEQTAALDTAKEDLNTITKLLTSDDKIEIKTSEIIENKSEDTKPTEVVSTENKTENTKDEKTETTDQASNSDEKENTGGTETLVANKDQKASKENKEVKVDTKISNIAPVNIELEKIFDKDKDLLASMSNNEMLDGYKDIKFYKPVSFYDDQVDIADKKRIYDEVNLNSYIDKDPINNNWQKLNEIRNKINKLKAEKFALKEQI